ncbi:SDR family oxidoreductase [Nocardia thailandica]
MGRFALKPLADQVVVVAGASSGIGRESARLLARRGARVVVAARGLDKLDSLVEQIRAEGGIADAWPCDVSDREQVQQLADAAVRLHGRIDTWVAVSAVVVYAGFADTTLEEFHRVMDVNFFGQVNGFQVALPRLREAGGGALISIGSGETVVAMPLNSAYAASKHAVEGMLDGLRRELMSEGVPISVTSIKPAAINTPFFDNARNKMDVRPKGAPPFYDPGVVADCVVYAAAHPVRDLYAGGAARLMQLGQHLAPGMVDRLLGRFGIPLSRSSHPAHQGEGNLDQPSADTRSRGDYGARAIPVSPYTWLSVHPRVRTALSIAGGAAAAGLVVRRSRRPLHPGF